MYDLPAEVQQVAILTVGAAWHSDYEVYAHTAEARHAGVPDSDVDAIVGVVASACCSGWPASRTGWPWLWPATTPGSHDDLYAEAHETFSTEPLIALVNLIGRYMNTAAMLGCFRVPAPSA